MGISSILFDVRKKKPTTLHIVHFVLKDLGQGVPLSIFRNSAYWIFYFKANIFIYIFCLQKQEKPTHYKKPTTIKMNNYRY